MALDPGIILQGQGVNALGILDASNRMAAQQKDALHTQGYRNMLATSGAGIMAGDQGALNALAGYDPAAALGIMGQRQDMDYRSQQMAALSAQEKRQAEEYARGLSAEQRAAEAAQIEEAVKMGMLIPDAATWDQVMAQQAPELVGQFDNRQALAGKYMSMADVLKMAFPEPPAPLSGPGKVAADIAGGFLPEGTPLHTPEASVTVNTGEGPSDAKLRGKLMEKEGELWSTYLQTGATSAGTVQDMAALDELIKVAPQGPVSGRLAEMFPGFSTAGDAFQSIVKRVAPTLRAPGSGATSDIEYDGMLRSLPALRNSPEANAAIAAMMKAKAAINVERANVISAYQNGQIDAPEARRAMADLDKRSIMTPDVAAILGVGPDTPDVSAATGGDPQPGGIEDGYRFKGGDPSDPANWEQVQ